MIHTAKEWERDVREAMRGGKGQAVIEHLVKASLPPKGRLMARITLDAGCSIGEHVHEGETEIFHFLSGTGRVLDDGVEIPVNPGDSMVTGSGHSHAVENLGQEPLVLLAVIILD